MATMRIGENYPEISSVAQWNDTRFSRYSQEEKLVGLLRENLRPATHLFTYFLYVIIIFTLGNTFDLLFLNSSLAFNSNLI